MDLDGFQAWLRRRGRSDATARHYRHQLERASSDGGVYDRLMDEELSPNTRRLTMAAAKSYARFAEDDKMMVELRDVQLPRGERVVPKSPLDADDWKDLIDHIETTGDLTNLEAGALSLLCRRGFRVGAIVNLKRGQVEDAIKTGTLVFSTKGRLLQYGLRPIKAACKRMLKDPWDVVARGLCPSAPEGHRLRKAAADRLHYLLRRQGNAALIDGDSIYPHRLRHTCATEFYKATKDIVALTQYMQWSSIDIASRYVGEMDRGELDKVAEGLFR